jgi:hypothetical protein
MRREIVDHALGRDLNMASDEPLQNIIDYEVARQFNPDFEG